MISERQRLISRRGVLMGGAALCLPALARPAMASVGAGALDAAELGVPPGLGEDQTDAIARALGEATGRNRPLFLQPGRYVIRGLDLPDGARIVGVPGATHLAAGGPGPILRARGASSVAIEGVTLEGLRLAGEEALLLLDGVQQARVEGCTLLDSAGSGIRLVGCSGRIRDCTVEGAAEAGIFSVDGQAIDILENRVSACGNNGILVWQSETRHDGATVRGNRIGAIRADGGGTGENGNAINVFRAGGVSVVDNVIDDCAFSAVRNNAGADIVISRNQCRGLGEVAIYTEFGYEGAVIANNIVHGAAQGISATNAAEGGRMAVISGNLIRDIVIGGVPEDRGIGIGVEAEASVTGNVVDGAAHAGLLLGWGPYLRNVVASGNVVRNARYGIAVSLADGAGPASVTGNMIAGSGEAAMAGFAWHELVTDDLAARAGDYAWLTVSGNTTS